MNIGINFMVIIALAVLAAMAFSAFWYSPRILGNAWMTLAGVHPEQSRSKGRLMMLYTAFAHTAIALTLFIILLWANAQTAEKGLIVGVWIGSGLCTMSFLVPYLWEGRPAKLFLITAGNCFCTVVLMCSIMAHLIGKFNL